jgi:hypothetical protein
MLKHHVWAVPRPRALCAQHSAAAVNDYKPLLSRVTQPVHIEQGRRYFSERLQDALARASLQTLDGARHVDVERDVLTRHP